MHVTAAAGLGFLLCVLWFDLMFDVQVLGHREVELPADVRDSIAAYYRRVTTNARPMNRLVAAVMLATLAGLVGEIVQGDGRVWASVCSLVLAAGAIGLAAACTVRRAVRLGAQTDSREDQSRLARAILRDHLACIATISVALVLQIALA